MKLSNVLSNIFSIDTDHVSVTIDIVIVLLPSPRLFSFWSFGQHQIKA